MLTAALTAISSVVRQVRFGNPEAEAIPVTETPRETIGQPEGNDHQGCETLREGFEEMGLHLDG